MPIPQHSNLTESEVVEYMKSEPETTSPPAAEGAVLTEAEILEDKVTRVSEVLNETSQLLAGIYGYIINEDGERITLSLTPYEIAPRLSDKELYPKGDMTQGLTIAKSVGKRLETSKVWTNFMQEVLPAPGSDTSLATDGRFGSKDDKIGMLSRFLSADGDESDKATFMHIVPDVDITGGKIEIPYRRYDGDGNAIDKLGTAYVPVNFNFVSNKYTLTIKEFIIENVSESSSEIYSLNKSFDGYTLRMFGQQPKIITFSGVLTNFDDDQIGIESSLKQQLGVATGSQRDVFFSYYRNFLAGTKCRDYNMKLYFYYNHKILEGYLLQLTTNVSSSNDNVVAFTGNMVIKREYTTFEAGVGLAVNAPNFRDYERSQGDLDITGTGTIFEEEITYRTNYRVFAIEESKKDLAKQLATNKQTREINEGVVYFENTTYEWFDDTKQFDKTNTSDMAELGTFCGNIVNGIVATVKIDLVGDLATDNTKCVPKLVDYVLNNNKSGFNRVIEYCISQNSGKNWHVNLLQDQTSDGVVDSVLDYLYTTYSAGNNILNSRTKDIMRVIDINKVFQAAHSSYFKEKLT